MMRNSTAHNIVGISCPMTALCDITSRYYIARRWYFVGLNSKQLETHEEILVCERFTSATFSISWLVANYTEQSFRLVQMSPAATVRKVISRLEDELGHKCIVFESEIFEYTRCRVWTTRPLKSRRCFTLCWIVQFCSLYTAAFHATIYSIPTTTTKQQSKKFMSINATCTVP